MSGEPLRLGLLPFRVIVCDNGSADGSVARILEWADGRLQVDLASAPAVVRMLFRAPSAKPLRCAVVEADCAALPDDDPPLTLVRVGRNAGFAGATNIALRLALTRTDCEYLWLLNNDTVIDTLAMSALVAGCAADPGIGLCGSTLLYYATPDIVQALGGATLDRRLGITRHIGEGSTWDPEAASSARRPDYIVGASMMATRAFVEAIGPLSEEYFLYYEELDWAMRARGRFRLGYAPKSIVYHKEGRSIGSGRAAQRSALSDYYSGRNRVLFMRRYFPWAMPAVYGGMLVSILKRIRRGQPERARELWRIMMAPERFNPHLHDPQLRKYRALDKGP